jgi:hypothetical protein
VVHFRPRVSDNLDIFGEEVVAVLERRDKQSVTMPKLIRASRGAIDCPIALRLEARRSWIQLTRPKRAGNC